MLKPQTFRPDDPLRALGIRPAAAALEEAQLREIAVLKARLAKRDWLLACRAKLEAQAICDVPRLHAPDPERFFREHWCLLR
ncbi:MAG: hypothetical protein SNJ79_10715, partial [Sphingomonadaceae bacterium]